MTAFTLIDNLEINDPTKEVVVIDGDDTNTYTSKKFSTVRAAQATIMEDTGALSIPLSLAISGAVVTVHCTGLSGNKVCLTLYGNK